MKLLSFFSLGLFLVGCGAHDSPASAESFPPYQLPADLKHARITYERDGHIEWWSYATESGGRVPGTRPRWSPDGDWIAYFHDGSVRRVFPETGEQEKLADADSPGGLAVSDAGGDVWFSSGGAIKAVEVDTREARVAAPELRALELDVSGDTYTATVKRFGGYLVITRNLSGEASRDVGGGCSASLSPDGTRVTRNAGDHTRLFLHDTTSGIEVAHISAPPGRKTDNQRWSSHPDWIVSMDEDSGHLYAHRVSDDAVFRVTREGGADRPDLWVPSE